jgi:hypothetical protein
VVHPERFGDLAITEDPDGEAVDPSTCPVTMALFDYVRVVAVRERFEGLADGFCVALVQQAAVSMMGVNDGKAIGVVEVVGPVPCSRSIVPILDILVSPVVRLIVPSEPVSARNESRAGIAVDDRWHLALVAVQPVTPRRWPVG